MFIDGLDEFDSPYDSVIKMITNLSDQEHLKICVSSRPLFAFTRAFSANPCLKLQDLTFDIIRDYIKLQLSDSIQQNVPDSADSQHRAEGLIRMIVDRADGVFLWAVIAVREVRDGLEGKANLDELARSIQTLPPKLENLFRLVLGRIKPYFQRDAAKFLQTVLFAGHIRGFDLCRLYLISSQDGSQDAPFNYENVAISELSEACRTLETRLLSHTAGFLELTPGDEHYLGYCEKKDWDQILFTRVQFIHRTVRDFLMNNSEAKSFLNDFGLSEAQVQLCIARGTLAHLAQHAEADTVMHEEHEAPGFWSDVEWPIPMLAAFQDVLRHVAMAEKLSGRAQIKLMQSLDYASLARGYVPTESPSTYSVGPYRAFTKDAAGISIDIVGMAAAAGMTIYVCEQLGLSESSAGYNPGLADHDEYSKARAAPAYLDWQTLDHLRDTAPHGHTPFRGPTYRQTLNKWLQWGEGAQVEDEQTGNYPLLESYVLCCCEPTSIDLVRILLKAGANPLVQVRSMDYKGFYFEEPGSFWCTWLWFLNGMRVE